MAGLTIFAYVGAVVVETIAGGLITGALAEHGRRRAIDKLRDHFITFDTTPSPDARLEVGDVLISVGTTHELQRLDDYFAPREAVAR